MSRGKILFGLAVLSTVLATFPVVSAELPEADDLFAKHVAASYGAGGLRQHQSIEIEAEILMQQYNIAADMTVKHKAPGFRAVTGTVFGEKQRSGCTLSSCWEESAEGFEVIQGNELQRWLEQADYYRWENIADYTKAIETVEQTKWQDKDVYKVRVLDSFDQENYYYFSQDTGLMLASEQMVADLGGFQARTESYQDYKQYGPFLLPAKTVLEQPTLTRVTTLKSVSFDAIPDADFSPPEEVVEMMSALQAEEG